MELLSGQTIWEQSKPRMLDQLRESKYAYTQETVHAKTTMGILIFTTIRWYITTPMERYELN